MSHPKINKLKLKPHQLECLPLFYNFILYNHMESGPAKYHYDEKRQHYVNYFRPEKLISKIINYEEEK